MAKKIVKYENKKGKIKEIVISYKVEDNYFDEMSTIGMNAGNRRFERENSSVENKKSYAVESLLAVVLIFLAIVILPVKTMYIVFLSVIAMLVGLYLGKFLYKIVVVTISNAIYTYQLQEYTEWKVKSGKESL